MVFVASGQSYVKTTSPFGGVKRSSLGGTCSSSGTYIKHSSPFFGRHYSSPCQTSYNNSYVFRPWFRTYSPPVVIYDNNPPAIINSRTTTFGDVVVITFLAVFTIALVTSALTRSQICTMGRDCEDVLNTLTGQFETVCSDIYERCI